MANLWGEVAEQFLIAERSYKGTHPAGGYPGYKSSKWYLATGKIDFENDVFKLALVKRTYNDNAIREAEGYGRLSVYSDFVSDQVGPFGGKVLQNISIAIDYDTSEIIITWDDMLFESRKESGGSMEYPLWYWEDDPNVIIRKSVLGVIYDETAPDKPVIQTFVVHSPNIWKFIGGGDSILIKDIQVRV